MEERPERLGTGAGAKLFFPLYFRVKIEESGGFSVVQPWPNRIQSGVSPEIQPRLSSNFLGTFSIRRNGYGRNKRCQVLTHFRYTKNLCTECQPAPPSGSTV